MPTYNVGTLEQIKREYEDMASEYRKNEQELAELEANKDRFAHYYDEIYNRRIIRKQKLEEEIKRSHLEKSYHETPLRSGIFYGMVNEDAILLEYSAELIDFIGNAFDGIYKARFQALLDITYNDVSAFIGDYCDYGEFKGILEFRCHPEGKIDYRLVALIVKYEIKELKEVDRDYYGY